MIIHCSKCGNKVLTTGYICSVCGQDNTPDRNDIMYIRCGSGDPKNYTFTYASKLQSMLDECKIKREVV